MLNNINNTIWYLSQLCQLMILQINVNLSPPPSPLREKVAGGRMRGQQFKSIHHFPLTLTLSLMERELFAA